MLQSALFAGDPLLQDIADDVGGVRISQHENASSPSVIKVQQALLIRDPACLPVSGADGVFGGESAAAIHSFKVEELGIEESQVIDDVGPLTVQRLDEIARAAEVTSVAVFNQFGDALADVNVEVDDDGTPRFATTDALGIAKLALTSGGTLTLEPATLALALGDLLDHPVIAADPSDPGDGAVIVTQTRTAVNIAPRSHVDIAVVARIDICVELKTDLQGSVRIVGSGMKIFREGENVRVALQANDGSTVSALLDPPPLAGALTPLPPITGWQMPNGYIVQPGDTEDSLSQRFLGVPSLFATLSDHPPIPGEVLALPDSAVPRWVRIGLEPLPPDPAPKLWFSVSPNNVISGLYTLNSQLDEFHRLLDAIDTPPPVDPDPSIISSINAEVVKAFLALPPELIAAEPFLAQTSSEEEGTNGPIS
jgi:hypothetical protein